MLNGILLFIAGVIVLNAIVGVAFLVANFVGSRAD